MAVTECPEKGVQSPTPIGGLDFLDMDHLLKYPEIKVLDFLDTTFARSSMGMKKGGMVKKCRMDGIALRGKTRAKERSK